MSSLYTAVIYRVKLVRVPNSEPLKGCSYFGQSVRVGSVEKVARARWTYEIWEAKNTSKEVGFIALLRKYGESAFDWHILDHQVGLYEKVQHWADEEEKLQIAKHGGILKDSTLKISQTLNQTAGGKGAHFASLDAHSRRAFEDFKVNMTRYVKEFKTSRVTKGHVCANGYKLYEQLKTFRLGGSWLGRTFEAEARAWLTSLPGFSFAPRDDSFSLFKRRMLEYVLLYEDANVPVSYECTDGYKLGRQLSNVRNNDLYLKGPEEDARRAWFSSLPGFLWSRRDSELHRQRLAVGNKQRFSNPQYKEFHVKQLQERRDAAIRKRRREYVVKVVRSALPYEPVKKKRVVGSFYHQSDGTIARCTTQLTWSFGGKRVNAEEIRSVGEM